MTELSDQCSAPQGGQERTGELDILGVGRPVLTAILLELFASMAMVLKRVSIMLPFCLGFLLLCVH